MCRFKFAQFSRTVGDAAVEQQRKMRLSIIAFSRFFSQSAYDAGAPWPFYALPKFELHASSVLLQSGNELLSINQFVKEKDEAAVLEFANNNFENWIAESHMIRYGNLDNMPKSTEHYHPYFTVSRNGTFVRDTEHRDQRTAMWQYSPRKFSKSSILIYPFL